MRATGPEAFARRLAILGALRSASGPVSGESLGATLGVSRTAVAKHVTALREAGYGIDAAHAGYTLTATPDAPLPTEVAPLLRTAFWAHLEGGGPTGSTNDDCRALAVAGAPEGAVVLASAQTGGRGRMGRAWESPEGGVYLTALLRPPLSPADAAVLSLAVGLGVARAFESLGARVALKWPNDVLAHDDGKVAGVLVEGATEGERLVWAVAGIGINVRRPAAAFEGAAYLDDLTARRAPLAEVAAAVLDGVAGEYGRLLESGFASLRDDYASRMAWRGRAVELRDHVGRLVAEGAVEGVDDAGRLLLRSGSGVRAVSSGEVSVRAAH